ncbi:MAG: HEAT repeat domain-containing protein [Anaerolineales bacterium]|nr:HEAT repeat domain-containing protein [Anaerolineales bacterium]
MSEHKLFDAAMVILEGMTGDSRTAKSKPKGESRACFPLDWLTDLGREQAAAFARCWRRLPIDARRDLIGRMEEEARKNFELDFLAVARIALDDPDPEVRVHAIRAFWECGDLKLVDRFLQFIEKDPQAVVRAGAAAALGAFVERSELEEIPALIGERITARLIAVIRGSDELEVRRCAVESVGYSSNPQVRAILENAHAHAEERMRASALTAMGRSADPSFADIVAAELRSPSPVLRAEAARAAGLLDLKRSVPQLIELLEDVDPAVRGCAVDSLGEIGGEKARTALEKMQKEAAGAEWDRIEAALENAEFQDSLGALPLLDLDGGEEEEDDQEDEDDGEGE